jgi:general secretion pathway protein D
LKATACFIIGCLTTWLALSATSPVAASHPVSDSLSAGMMILMQQSQGSPSAESQEAARRLKEARQAMSRGDLQTAEKLIASAEQLNVQYDPLYERFLDTPAKARRSLNELLAAAAAGDARPSQRFSPTGSQPRTMPGATGGQAAVNPASPQQRLDMITDDARSRTDRFLDQGRAALHQGDTAGAVGWWQKAAAVGGKYGPGEYSPETLAAELRKAGVPEQHLIPPAPITAGLADTRPPMNLRPDDVRADDQPGLPSPAAPSQADLRNSAFSQHVVTNPNNPAAAGPVPPRRLPTPQAAADARKVEVLRLLAMSRATLDRGDAVGALRLAQSARDLGVSDNAFGPNEPRPEHLLMEIQSVLHRRGQAGASLPGPATNAYAPLGTSASGGYPVRQSVYDPSQETARTMPAQATEPILGNAAPLNPVPPGTGTASPGLRLYEQGIRALEHHDRDAALQLFSEAWQHEAELDPATRQTLRDKLTLLRVATPTTSSLPPGSPLEEVDSQQRLLRDKLFREITREQSSAEKMRTSDPRGSLDRLHRLRTQVEEEPLDPVARRQLLTLVDRSIQESERYIEQNLADIELRERNDSVSEDIARRQQDRIDRQSKLAELVEQFNDLIEEQRFAEAEVIAKQADALEPDAEVVRSMLATSKFAWRVQEQDAIRDLKERGFYDTMTAAEESAIPFDDRTPMVFADAKEWDHISHLRGDWLRDQNSRLTPAEMEIQSALKTEVDVRFENRPLAEVMETLGRMSGVNVYLDPQGLHAEGITTDEPVSINLTQPISLRSALNLILEPLHLSYVIQNEVLRITSEQTRDSDTYPRVYNVADLVIPIPNFMPSYNIGLPGALREAINATGQVRQGGGLQSVPMTFASNDTNQTGATNASVLAQMGSSGMLPTASSRTPSPMGFGPGNMGGATMADFDTLIELVTSTIAPTTWDTVGGPGSIEGFPTNLSLVISQTQEVHEQIADLLDQLRRLQDLQVTIEVRFITLNDRFFERIGVDFDFDIDDNSNQIANQAPILPDDTGPSISFGLDPSGIPTIDYDYQFNQGSFGSTVPQFGGFDAATAANFGFAILSDIEVFFLLQAAQGDDRTNVLQAPKVTLFNGQTGFVSDTSQRPFVTSVVPVVGDFAAAHQPVVVVLSEGTSLSVQAVVSPDRRFVRLTLVPFFSTIGDVDTFTFTGRVTSDSGSIVADPTDENSNVTNNQTRAIEGTTVQLPTFNFTTVSTTVSVPDGGTVLLGGIKRLSEGRNERGVPMLNKLPYISRLFKNVGIGRDTQSLMMMVTPRIIIQEEEEFLQTGYNSSEQ